MRIVLSNEEMEYLVNFFSDLMNYSSDDPLEPINPLSYREPEGDSCLHIAAFRGEYRAVFLLLKSVFDINERGDMGYTALHYAYLGGNKEVIDLLIKNGASSELKNDFGLKPGEK